MAEIIRFQRRRSSASIEGGSRSLSPAAFVLVIRGLHSDGPMQFVGQFATEEAAMSYAEIVIPPLDEGTSFWVTELEVPHETECLSREELMQRGWSIVGDDQSILGGLAYNGMAKDVPTAE